MSKTALITGITGQDGSFLAEFLLEKGYEVHGIIRRSSSFNTGRIEHLYLDEWVRDMKNKRLLTLHYGDMTDSSSLVRGGIDFVSDRFHANHLLVGQVGTPVADGDAVLCDGEGGNKPCGYEKGRLDSVHRDEIRP